MKWDLREIVHADLSVIMRQTAAIISIVFIEIISMRFFFNLLHLKGHQFGCLSWPFSNVCLLLNHIVCFNQTLYTEYLGSGFLCFICENDFKNLLLL